MQLLQTIESWLETVVGEETARDAWAGLVLSKIKKDKVVRRLNWKCRIVQKLKKTLSDVYHQEWPLRKTLFDFPGSTTLFIQSTVSIPLFLDLHGSKSWFH